MYIIIILHVRLVHWLGCITLRVCACLLLLRLDCGRGPSYYIRLENCYTLELSRSSSGYRILTTSGFWIQAAVLEAKKPLRNRFRIETAIMQFYQKRNC
jgi:hypothetical protein